MLSKEELKEVTTEKYNRICDSAFVTELAYFIAKNEDVDKMINTKLEEYSNKKNKSYDMFVLFHLFCDYAVVEYVSCLDDIYEMDFENVIKEFVEKIM